MGQWRSAGLPVKKKMRLVGSMEKCWIAREKENMVGAVNGNVMDCL
ncbi:hypothetical protein [Neobacillus mesonae]|nr:hypothetical protein [Neobacillus mesonae]MCM3570841.1 hypothetical protein [Neobacillus mesonae]